MTRIALSYQDIEVSPCSLESDSYSSGFDSYSDDDIRHSILPVATRLEDELYGPKNGEEYLFCVRREAKTLPNVTVASDLPPIAHQSMALHHNKSTRTKYPQKELDEFMEWFFQTKEYLSTEALANEHITISYPENLDEVAWKSFCYPNILENNEDIIFPKDSIFYKTILILNHKTIIRLIQLHSKWIKQYNCNDLNELAFPLMYRWIINLLLRLDNVLLNRQDISVLRDLGKQCINMLDNSSETYYQYTILSILSKVYYQHDLFE